MLIRRFEERAGEMYAKAKVGGFLHLAIGEEATIVGSARAHARRRLPDLDLPLARPRARARHEPRRRHGRAVRPRRRRARKGRGGSMHMFDLERRFMGGYGIVGGNLPIAAGFGLAADYLGTEDATLCTFGDGASNQGTFGETMNLAALWKLPVVFMVTNNQFGMGTALERHSAVTDLQRQGRGLRRARHGVRRHGRARHPRRHAGGAAHRARGAPAGARRGDHLPLPRPLDGRPRGVPHQGAGRGVAQARPDPAPSASASRPRACVERRRARAVRRRTRSRASTTAVAFADASPIPPPESLYDDVYVLGGQVRGWYSVDERSAGVHKGEDERELAEQHASSNSRRQRRARRATSRSR